MKAGPSIERQKAAMLSVGLNPDDALGQVYLDDRNAAIASLAPGDELVVASAECLGHPESDVLEALADIGARSAAVFDVEAAQRVEWHPSAQMALLFAVRAGSEARKAIAARARRSRVASGNLGGVPAIEWDREAIGKLRAMFEAGEARQRMADALGVSRATVQRKLRELGLIASK